MLLKKFKYLLILSGVCIGLCGCNFRIGRFAFLEDDNAKAKKHIDEIVNALDVQDANKLKALFSKNVQNDVKSLDEDIATVFGYYRGKMQSIDYSSANATEDLAQGTKRKTISCGAEIHTDEDDYTILMDYVIKNTKDRADEGLLYINIVRAGEEDEYAYPEYMEGKGIFAPVLIDEEEIEKRRQHVYDKHPEFFDEHPEALDHFRIFEEYPEILDEKPTVFDKYPSLLENLDECDQTPYIVKYYPDYFEEDESE